MKKEGEIHIFGIRHHGPGSARSLLRALQEVQPDVIALELMDDRLEVFEHLQNEHIEPPLAVLLHLKDDSRQNILLPFAEFSPEWQCLQFAREHRITVQPIDLPYAYLSALEREERVEASNEDVLMQLAQLSGFRSVESWWDHFLERQAKEKAIFPQLQEIMMLLREGAETEPSNLIREAYMRRQLRKLRKKHQKIAVVCGAFHGPALTIEALNENTRDKELLKGLKKNKIQGTLIPFSYKRLSRSSGYSSGVTAPLFYEMLFTEQEEIAVKWLSHAAHVLRNKGFTVSVDEVMGGVHLSHQLCHLRQLETPGLPELREAALTTLCHGSEERLELIQDGAFIGHKIGKVPDDLVDSPFIKDFYAKMKSFRLSKYWQADDPKSQKPVKELDLRKDMHLQSSHFLHQLNLLDMDWARRMASNERAQGSFQEHWKFYWDIEHEIQLHHIGTLGASVAQAAEYVVLEKLDGNLSLKEAIRLLDKVLLAQITAPVPAILQRLNVLTAGSEDLSELLDANIRLVEISKYGSVRKMDTDTIFSISERLHHKICNLLPYSCPPMEEDVSYDLFQQIANYYQLLRQTQFEGWVDEWLFALDLLLTHDPIDGRISGFGLRMLHEQAKVEDHEVQVALNRHLDSAYEPLQQAIWLEGFLYGGGSVLLYNEALFRPLFEWVKSIDPDTFTLALPLLSRTFSSYPNSDRQKILDKVRKGQVLLQKEEDLSDQLLDWAEEELGDAFNKLRGL